MPRRMGRFPFSAIANLLIFRSRFRTAKVVPIPDWVEDMLLLEAL